VSVIAPLCAAAFHGTPRTPYSPIPGWPSKVRKFAGRSPADSRITRSSANTLLMETTMKSTIPRTVGALLIATSAGIAGLPPSVAAPSEHARHTAPAGNAMADGQVRKIDRLKGAVVIAHGPLPNGMPAMTMGFRPKENAWLDQLKEGQKIRFSSEEVNGVMILQGYEVVK
jgi:Cu/Ag efflux protein CusF